MSIINNRVQPAIFEDIAQEAINICRQSLVLAAEMIKGVKTNVISQAPGSSYVTSKTLDGELFLVRHLLILKEVTQNLDLVGRDDAARTVDLSAVTGTFTSIKCDCEVLTDKQTRWPRCLDGQPYYRIHCSLVWECPAETRIWATSNM